MWQTKEVSQIFKELKTSYKGLSKTKTRKIWKKYFKGEEKREYIHKIHKTI